MPGLVPGIHVLTVSPIKAWMAGPSPRRSGFGRAGGTSPALTTRRACSLRPLRRLHPEPRLHRLAHQEFLDLSGHRHREFLDELHIARNLVMRDLALAEGSDLVRRQGFAGANPHPCAKLLAVAIVGDAEHLHVLDL